MLPIVREHGTLEDLEDKNGSLRLVVLEQPPWRFVHWTPFNALAAGEAPPRVIAMPWNVSTHGWILPYGLDVHESVKVLGVLWADSGTSAVIRFIRGAWEEAAMTI